MLATMLATCRMPFALLRPVWSVFGAATACGKAAESFASTAGPRAAGSAPICSHSFRMVKLIEVGCGHASENG